MVPENRLPTHPGVILREEFLVPSGITQVQLAAHIGIPLQRVNEIVLGKRGITPETALYLSQALDTTPEFWLNLQSVYDLAKVRRGKTRRVKCLLSHRGEHAHAVAASARRT